MKIRNPYSPGTSLSEYITRYLSRHDYPLHVSDIREYLKCTAYNGEKTKSNVSQRLVELARNGSIVRVRRGMYTMPPRGGAA